MFRHVAAFLVSFLFCLCAHAREDGQSGNYPVYDMFVITVGQTECTYIGERMFMLWNALPHADNEAGLDAREIGPCVPTKRASMAEQASVSKTLHPWMDVTVYISDPNGNIIDVRQYHYCLFIGMGQLGASSRMSFDCVPQ